MAGGLYSRVASRGFNNNVTDGYTGAAALADSGGPQNPRHASNTYTGQDRQTLTGFTADPPAELAAGSVILEGAWGTPGAIDQDRTPRTHAAPAPVWAGSYSGDELAPVREWSADLHAFNPDGNPVARRYRVERPEPAVERLYTESEGDSLLQKATGQLRAHGGYDVDQGYGTVNGYGFGGGHRDRIMNHDGIVMAYLDPAERPFVVPQPSGTFHTTDAVNGPQPEGNFLDAGNINATPPTPYTPPADPATATAAPAGAAASAGWWR